MWRWRCPSGRGEVLLHLVNLVRESPLTDFQGSVENIIGEDIIPIADIRVSLPLHRAPSAVVLHPMGHEVPFEWTDGAVALHRAAAGCARLRPDSTLTDGGFGYGI